MKQFLHSFFHSLTCASARAKKLTYSGLIASALSFSSLHSNAEIEILDMIVAIVDDRAITRSQLDMRLSDIQLRARQTGMALPPEAVLKEQILDALINETLQLNAAARYGVSASDSEVEAAIENIRRGQKVTAEQLKREIETSGATYHEFKESIRKQLNIQQISTGLVNSRTQVNEQDVDSFLKSADAQFWSSPDYNLGHILIPIPKSASFEDVQAIEKKANKIYQQLLDGANFEAMAVAESKGPAALKGGDLGWRKSSALPSLFVKIVPDLKEGQVAKPQRSMAGFHILKLKGKRGDEKQLITQSKVRHILLKTNEIRNGEKAKQELNEIKVRIQEGQTTFEEQAKEKTDDIASKLSGGDMGWTSPGVFVPEFENVMTSIDVGKISEPFETQFGWHILEVVERREEDVTDDMLRMRARNIIRSRRFEDELQIWLQELKDAAFIDIRIQFGNSETAS